MNAHVSTDGAAAYPDAVLVPRPDHGAYRRRWLANLALVVGGIGLVVYGLVADDDSPYRLGALVSGLFLVPFVVWATTWQRRTWLDPEPSLVLAPTRFRILHKGEHVWVPWTDVADLDVAVRGRGIGTSRSLLFLLRPDASTVLPQRRAPLADRAFSWHPGHLAYSRPSEVPALPEVVATAVELWATANGIPVPAPSSEPSASS